MITPKTTADRVKHPSSGAFYTPKTYGVTGGVIQGFSVDNMIKPGCNFDDLNNFFDVVENGSSPTFKLLKWHIRRTLLHVLLTIVSYYKMLPVFVKRMFSLRSGMLDFKEFEETARNTWPGKLNLEKEVENFSKIPKHVGIILKYYKNVVPPPPELPEPYINANKEIVYPSEEDIQLAKEVIKECEKEQEEHDNNEGNRLVTEITDIISWAVVSKIPILTIYEQSGFIFSNLDQDRVISSTRDKLALNYGVTDVKIKIHVRAENKVLTFSNNDSELSSAAPSPSFDNDNNNNNNDAVLNVILLQETDVRTAVTRVAENVSLAYADGSLELEEVTQEFVNQAILQSLSSSSSPTIQPDLLILLGSNATVDGYPSYALKNALVYRDFTHKPTPDVKLFCRALKAFSQ